jgi:hypothetical protein
MDDIIRELEDRFTFRLLVDFRKLNKSVIPDPYPIPRVKELNRVAKNKVYKTTLNLKYCFGAMGFCRDHFKFMAVITPSGIFIPTRLAFGGQQWSCLYAKVVCFRLDKSFRKSSRSF